MTYADDHTATCPDIPTVPAFLASLDSFDAMADMLDQDALAVPLELLLSTTHRALRALGALLSASLACSRSQSSSGCSSAPIARSGTGFVSRTQDNLNMNTAADHAPSGVRDPLRALALLDASLHRVLCTVFSSLAAHHPGSIAALRGPQQPTQISRMQTPAAAALGVDGVLGSLYALVLAPLVRAFAPASEAFVSVCLRPCSFSGSGSGFGFGPESGSGSLSGISYGAEYPPPGSGGNSEGDCDNDNDGATADLRPVLFDVLERALSVLELEGQRLGLGLRLGLGSSGAGTDSLAGASAGSANKRLETRTIPGVREVKRLLALDCVRELERMYVSRSHSHDRDAAAESSEDHPTTSTDASIRRGRSDVAPGGSAATRQGQGTLPHSLLALWPGSAPSCARKAHASPAGADRAIQRDRDGLGSGGASEDPTRPGTPASCTPTTTSALGPLRAQVLHLHGHEGRSPAHAHPQASAGRTGRTGMTRTLTGWGAGPPRSARNLGETRAGAGCGVSSDDAGATASAGAAAALGLGFAHAYAQRRSARGEGEDRIDLRGHDDGGLGLGERFGERLVRLARKDATWYLCAVLSRLLPGSAAGSGSNTGAKTTTNSASSCNASRPAAEDVGAANANAASVKLNPNLSLTNTDATDTIADEAVYTALVDLLRRSRPAQYSSFLPGRRGGGGAGASSDPSTSTRADTAGASIRDSGSSRTAGGADRHASRGGDSRLGRRETVAMGEVERGMLLAVFERAWLGLAL